MRCGVRCLDDCFSRVSGRPLKGGYIMVIQTHGRNGQYNPHLHVIATSGGWDARKQWRHLDYLPYPLLRKKCLWHLLTMLRQMVKSKERVHRLVDTCYTRYREGVCNQCAKRGCPPAVSELGAYLAKYVVSPPIALRRIDRYRVTSHYRSHKSERSPSKEKR